VPALTRVLHGSDRVAHEKAASALQFMPPGSLETLDLATADALVRAVMVAIPTISAQLTVTRAIDAILRLPRSSAVKALPALRAMEPAADRFVRPAVIDAIERLSEGP
jgi:hypothetical protein